MKRGAIYLALAIFAMCACQKELDEPVDEGAGRPVTDETQKPDSLPELGLNEIAFKASSEFFYADVQEKTEGIMLVFRDSTEAVLISESQVDTVMAKVYNTVSESYFIAKADSAETYYSVYPATVQHTAKQSEEGLILGVRIPDTQNGELSEANIAVTRTTGAAARLDFRNICGLLKFTTESTDIKSVTFRGAEDEALTGMVSVTGFDEQTGNPIFGEPSDTRNRLTLQLDGKSGTFYMALLPGLVLEKGFKASFEMMPDAVKPLEDAESGFSLTMTRSEYNALGAIEDFISQPEWFVTPEGSETADGLSWETAISAEQMFQMLAFNRPQESGVGDTTTDLMTDEYKEQCSDYLEEHRTKHALQLDGATFHLAAGEYNTRNYVRVSFPEQKYLVKASIKGGYDPASTGKDRSKRDTKRFRSEFRAPIGSGTARAFFLQANLDMTFDGVVFTGCMGDGTVGGGALLLNESSSSSFLFRDCVFDANASNSYGGAIVGSKSVGSVTFDSCTFKSNKAAKTGGAIHFTDGEWAFNDCDFESNSSTGAGGAISAAGAEATLVINGGSFTTNVAATNAGAINMNCASFSLTGVTFLGNEAKPTGTANAQGGAIYFTKNEEFTQIRNLKDCVFKENKVSAANAAWNNDTKTYVRGGAVYIAGLPKVMFDGCSFEANEQKDYDVYKNFGGGAIYAVSPFEAKGCAFKSNTAYAGGALGSTSEFTCMECDFTSNNSLNNGGACWLNPVSNATFMDCNFSSNRTEANVGGAIYLSGTSLLNMTGGTVEKNFAGGNGGGVIYNSGASQINITDVDFVSNEAAKAGGVIWNSNDGAVITIGGESSFSENKAGTNGGVIFTKNSARFIIKDAVTFSDNTADGQGGVMCATRTVNSDPYPSPTVKVTGATFTENTAVKEAGVFCFYGGEWSMENCLVEQNSSESNGGAIYSNTGTLTVSQCGFEGNSTSTTGVGGGAIYVTTGSVLSVDASIFISNTASNKNGGAINIAGTAVGMHKINNTHFAGNGAIEGGAMFVAAGGTLYMNGCSFSGNLPTKNDTGGVLKTNATTFINNCSFYENSTGAWQADLIICGAGTVLNSTIIEKSSASSSAHTNGIRVYGNSSSAMVYNNVILSRNRNLTAGYGNNKGEVTSQGYNYTGAWSTQVDNGVTGVANTVVTDKVVTPADVFDNFTLTNNADGRNWYTWEAPGDLGMTTKANVETFLNGVTGGSDFLAWLNTVGGLTKDIAGNDRPATGWYPGCYQGTDNSGR